jgi:signal transduction histidine kinase
MSPQTPTPGAPGTPPAARLPAIRQRLNRVVWLWSLLWGVVVVTALWLAAVHEVDELMDDSLRTTAELLVRLQSSQQPVDSVPASASAAPGTSAVQAWVAPSERLALQLAGPDGQLRWRSGSAPPSPWLGQVSPGFSDVPGWRVFGVAVPDAQAAAPSMLYIGHTREERLELRLDVALGGMLAVLAMGGVGHLWLQRRMQAELQPLQSLSQQLAHWDPSHGDGQLVLAPASRQELQPIHEALAVLGERLAARLAHEQSFSAQAAHVLRTPLAGIDVQLALALRESAPEGVPRLQRVRDATHRLQTVVTALLQLFRSGLEPQRAAVDLPALLSRWPLPSLHLALQAPHTLDADPDLLLAALLNLLDNAERHGARQLQLQTLSPVSLVLQDDGPGMDEAHRQQRQAALDAQHDDGLQGLGLVLADRVCRAHGGRLQLLPSDSGLRVWLGLSAQAQPSAR